VTTTAPTSPSAGSHPDGHHPVTPAGHSPRAWALLGGVTFVALAADLATKYWAFAAIAGRPVRFTRADVLSADRLGDLIPPHNPVVVVPSVLELTLVLNPGAVFGIGAGKRWFFAAFTVVALGFCLWLFARWTHARDRLVHFGLALVIAGGLGNLYDRLVYACVRDFLHPLAGVPMPFGLRWPGGSRELWPYVSNVADAFLLVGIVLILWFSFRTPKSASEAAPASANS
jgi:signal peptidase II